MKTRLLELIEAIGTSRDLPELKAHLFPAATQYFEATRGALFLTADVPDEPRFRQNPVMRALLESHAPLHEGQLAGEIEWKAMCSRADHGHALVGPLVQQGELIGALAFTRGREAASFDSTSVTDLSALCLHASTRIAGWQTQAQERDWGLSPREHQIAELVAQGKTNAQIGRELFVSSETIKAALKAVFRKTGVGSRAQLVAVLARNLQS